MARNTHNRQRDHSGTDLDTNIQINGAVGGFGDGANLHTVLGSVAGPSGMNVIIYGGTAPIATGVKGYVVMPYDGEITQVTLLADQTGSIVIDIWKDTYANFPPTNADSITASAPPTISSSDKSQDSTLTGWTTTFSTGDILAFNVDSNTTIGQVTVALKIQRTG